MEKAKKQKKYQLAFVMDPHTQDLFDEIRLGLIKDKRIPLSKARVMNYIIQRMAEHEGITL